MKDFEKTKSMVERWNFLVMCLEDPYASEDGLNDTEDEMFRLSARLPITAQSELIEVADLPNMQMWFDVWVRNLIKLERMRDFLHYDLPQDFVLKAKSHEHALFQELGKKMKETAYDYHLSLPTLPEHFLSPWDAIEAAEDTITDDVVQYATDDEIDSENPVSKGMESRELRRIFHGDFEELKKFLISCSYAKNDSQKKRMANDLVKRKIIFKEDANKSLYDELKHIGIIKCQEVTWRGAL